MSATHIFSFRNAAAFSALLAATTWIAGCGDKSTGPGEINYLGDKKIALTNPRGGETFHVGDTVVVKWKVTDENIMNSIVVRLSGDNGATWPIYLNQGSTTPTDPDWEKFQWVIQAEETGNSTTVTVANNHSLRIRVEHYFKADTTMESPPSGKFTVLPKPIP